MWHASCLAWLPCVSCRSVLDQVLGICAQTDNASAMHARMPACRLQNACLRLLQPCRNARYLPGLAKDSRGLQLAVGITSCWVLGAVRAALALSMLILSSWYIVVSLSTLPGVLPAPAAGAVESGADAGGTCLPSCRSSLTREMRFAGLACISIGGHITRRFRVIWICVMLLSDQLCCVALHAIEGSCSFLSWECRGLSHACRQVRGVRMKDCRYQPTVPP